MYKIMNKSILFFSRVSLSKFSLEALDSPEHIFVHLRRTMDEDDPEISPDLGEDEANVPQ